MTLSKLSNTLVLSRLFTLFLLVALYLRKSKDLTMPKLVRIIDVDAPLSV